MFTCIFNKRAIPRAVVRDITDENSSPVLREYPKGLNLIWGWRSWSLLSDSIFIFAVSQTVQKLWPETSICRTGPQKRYVFGFSTLRPKVCEVITLQALKLYYSKSWDNFQSDAKEFGALLCIVFEIWVFDKFKKSVVRDVQKSVVGRCEFWSPWT